MQVETVPIPMSCALDTITSSFCNVLLCFVLKFSLCVDWYLFKPQEFSLRSINMQFGCEIIIIITPGTLKYHFTFIRDKLRTL